MGSTASTPIHPVPFPAFITPCPSHSSPHVQSSRLHHPISIHLIHHPMYIHHAFITPCPSISFITLRLFIFAPHRPKHGSSSKHTRFHVLPIPRRLTSTTHTRSHHQIYEMSGCQKTYIATLNLPPIAPDILSSCLFNTWKLFSNN